ncbi:MAG: CRISPR-associated endonuclease Cas2 [Firmicutes bacterium]|nr:CRISPR-associated endonuclease Cas2 [Bacillota bacterium]
MVAYDIANPTRLRKVFQAMRGFGDPIQLSIFLCDLSATERVLLSIKLNELIHHREDRVLIVNLGPSTGSSTDRIDIMGRQELPETPRAVII